MVTTNPRPVNRDDSYYSMFAQGPTAWPPPQPDRLCAHAPNYFTGELDKYKLSEEERRERFPWATEAPNPAWATNVASLQHLNRAAYILRPGLGIPPSQHAQVVHIVNVDPKRNAVQTAEGITLDFKAAKDLTIYNEPTDKAFAAFVLGNILSATTTMASPQPK